MKKRLDFKLEDPPKGILKNKTPQTVDKEKEIHLTWDEENLRITELQKDAKMKIDEPPTPYVHYNIETDSSLQDLDELRLSPASSRSSSVTSSPKRAKFVEVDWSSESEDESADENADAEDIDKHKRFEMMRSKHYAKEGIYVKNVGAPHEEVNEQPLSPDEDSEPAESSSDLDGSGFDDQNHDINAKNMKKESF